MILKGRDFFIFVFVRSHITRNYFVSSLQCRGWCPCCLSCFWRLTDCSTRCPPCCLEQCFWVFVSPLFEITTFGVSVASSLQKKDSQEPERQCIIPNQSSCFLPYNLPKKTATLWWTRKKTIRLAFPLPLFYRNAAFCFRLQARSLWLWCFCQPYCSPPACPYSPTMCC